MSVGCREVQARGDVHRLGELLSRKELVAFCFESVRHVYYSKTREVFGIEVITMAQAEGGVV
jgi:hypothetical protein